MEINPAIEFVSNVYLKLKNNIIKDLNVIEKPLILTEKILSSHSQYNDKDFTLTNYVVRRFEN